MRLTALLLLLAPFNIRAGEPVGKIVYERWESAYLAGSRSGRVRTTIVEKPMGNKVLFEGNVEMRLQVRRFSNTVPIGMDTGTVETAAGIVTGVSMKQYLGKKQNLEIQGTVEGKLLKLTLNRTQALQPAPWNERVVGLYRQQSLFKDLKVKPGDAFAYLSFEPSINLVVNTRVFIKEHEMVEIVPGSLKRKLLRVEVKADKIQTFQPPPLVMWLDDQMEPVRSETDAPGLGPIVLVRTNREQALAPLPAGGKVAEVHQYVSIGKTIARPHQTRSAVYRIRVKDDDAPGTTFTNDLRQQVRLLAGLNLEVRVKDGPAEASAKVADEYKTSSYFIKSDDAKVRELARRAVGNERDAWAKAQRIEKWVFANMSPEPHEALATADHVARTLAGDCTEYSMLTAAMCRAEGIPSRTAIGLVYGEVRGSPVFAFHMWTEVWIDGQWRPLDATLGQGGIGATHLKVCDQSWHEERSMTPLLPVLRIVGRLSIDVVSAE